MPLKNSSPESIWRMNVNSHFPGCQYTLTLEGSLKFQILRRSSWMRAMQSINRCPWKKTLSSRSRQYPAISLSVVINYWIIGIELTLESAAIFTSRWMEQYTMKGSMIVFIFSFSKNFFHVAFFDTLLSLITLVSMNILHDIRTSEVALSAPSKVVYHLTWGSSSKPIYWILCDPLSLAAESVWAAREEVMIGGTFVGQPSGKSKLRL